MTTPEIPPVRVEVVNQPKPEVPRTKYRRRAATLTTHILSTTNPTSHVLPMSPRRCEAYLIQYTDADVVLCHSESIAIKQSGLPDFSETVDGAIIAKGFQTPVPLDTTDDLWVTANSTALGAGVVRVSVLDFIYAED